MDRDKLKAAIEADVISADQAARLEAMFTRKEGEEAEAEPLRFLSNLNDVFLSIGLLSVLVPAFQSRFSHPARFVLNILHR